ncbi:MAG: GNAT family N-acetyltransferase [Clostridia bacterium]|nr:GNAT family N-acetyltransferase [Clostridia bacterium]MDD4685749.1 GNAT family N-acetyltransferase [Clostridia bacterium]
MYKIEKTTYQDISEIYEISVEQFGENSWNLNLFKDEIDRLKTKNQNGKRFAYVIRQDEKVVSFIFFILTEGMQGLDYNIINLATKNKFKNMGFATALLNFAKSLANKNNIRKIWLEVRENNLLAINLYKKFGFYLEYIRKGYYSNGDNACIMSINF